MKHPTLSRKRRLCNGHNKEPSLRTKKSLKALISSYQSDRATERLILKTSCGLCCVNGKHLTDNHSFSKTLSSWTDTQHSVMKVLEHLNFKQTPDDIHLNTLVNNKFLKFRRDITEECGTEDKQHSWAVIEKQEEIVMYGPYYPNYNKGLHSEDIIVKRTEELLLSEDVSEDWKVYIFTMNSPCLARNTEPCMLNLVKKAQEWWSVYRVKTHIGFMKCWGFKGTKENLFREINYRQVDCINQSEDYESYSKEKKNDIIPVCENLFSSLKRLLKSASFPFLNSVQGQDWRSYFKSMHCIYECKPEEEKEIITEEVNSVIKAAQTLLSETSHSLAEILNRGHAFASEYSLSSHISDAIQDQLKLTFQECWSKMVQDKYADFIKEKLTEDFNHCTVQLFVKDVAFAEEYLRIGRIQFSNDINKVSNTKL